ncbi:hypothetical protein AK830_g399 [Neonectria ditissima]|uniref:DUF7600 domain-containing protein n=1 Tax=Neonectria ditissima TaxID=78410 RepID=A0A0P7B7B7_9HYPO|nr:hypothetical protein AK830_g399 [Neonectria ditissima]
MRHDDQAVKQGGRLYRIDLSQILISNVHRRVPGQRIRWGFGFHPPCWDLLHGRFKPSPKDLFFLCMSFPVGDEDALIDWGHEYGGAATRMVDGKATSLRSSNTGAPYDDYLYSDPMDVPIIQLLMEGVLDYSPDLKDKPFSFEAKATSAFKPKSWRSLHLSLQQLRKKQNPAAAGLTNRKRVWNLIHFLKSLWTELSDVPCQGRGAGTFYKPLPEEESEEELLPEDEPIADDGLLPQEYERIWATASRGLNGPTKEFRRGCRTLRVFVSGLRFEQLGGRSTSLGYVHPDREVRVCFPKTVPQNSEFTIQGWKVALDWSGISAVAVVTETGIQSSWVGRYEGLPKQYLKASSDGSSDLKLEFDALKVVSLSISRSPRHYRTAPWRNSFLWSPDVLGEDVYLNNDGEVREEEIFNRTTFSTIFFGGKEGEDLSRLSEIVVSTLGAFEIKGIQFRYVDSEPRTLGRLLPPGSDTERFWSFEEERTFSIPIDGPGCEWITGIENPHEGAMVESRRVFFVGTMVDSISG